MKRLFLLLLLCILFVSLRSGYSTDKHEIIIKPTKYIATIAIPPFSKKESAQGLKKGAFSEILYRDLEISGFFRRPQNQNFVDETHRLDLSRDKIDFAEWKRLGCSFLVKGDYQLKEKTITADCYLYDVNTGQRVFGKNFGDYSRTSFRSLAHRISDEIIRYVTHEQGIASTRIVYISKQGRGKEMYIMDVDGFNQCPLTKDGNLAATPCWGYNTTEIYYTSYKEYNPDLWALRLKDGKSGVISSHPGFNLSPSWCEKTRKIALTLSKDGNSEIYTMDHRGGGYKRLTFHGAIDSSPCFSPEGNQIVFTSDRTGTPQIYVMDSEGLNVRRLTYKGSYNDSAVWSPKGDRLACVSRVGGAFHIFLMNVDGTDWLQLTNGTSNNEDPSWAPDGHHIAFTSNRTGSPQIYMICDDGSNLVQLTFKGKNQSAAWSPFLY